MARTTTEAAIVGGPTIESTRDHWVLHLKSEHRAERTISNYLNALRRLDAFLADRGMPRELRARTNTKTITERSRLTGQRMVDDCGTGNALWRHQTALFAPAELPKAVSGWRRRLTIRSRPIS